MYYQTFRYVLVIFMEKDTENEANFQELTKKFKQVTFIQVVLTLNSVRHTHYVLFTSFKPGPTFQRP